MKILLFTVFCLAIIWISWRLACRVKSIPCPAWLGWLVEKNTPFSKINHALAIIKNSDICLGMTILDAGCGPGRIAIPAAKAIGIEGQVIAMDIQKAMLIRVQKKAEKESLTNIKFLEARLGEKKLAANEFDRALLVTVLGEIPDREAALQEIFTALKPNGLLSITEIISDPHYQSKKSILQIASSIGFQEKKTIGNKIAFTLVLEKPSTNPG